MIVQLVEISCTVFFKYNFCNYDIFKEKNSENKEDKRYDTLARKSNDVSPPNNAHT